MIYLAIALIVIWAWGWGFYTHDSRPVDSLVALFWPVLSPLGHLIHWWDWGGKNHCLIRYNDMKWWHRGLKERR